MDMQTNAAVGTPTVDTRYSIGSIVVTLAVSLVTAMVLGSIYGPAVHYSPIIYLNIVLALGMGWLNGHVARNMIRLQTINRSSTAAFIGAAAGVFGILFSWLAYVFILAEYDFTAYFDFLVHPWYLFDLAGALAHNPIWTFGSGTGALPAIVYYLVWIIEAGILFFTPLSMCRTFVRENLLCSGCGGWVVPTGDVAYFLIDQEAHRSIVQRLMANDVAALFELPRIFEPSLGEWVEAVGLACPGCEDRDGYVSIYRVVETEGKKNKKPEISRAAIALNVPVSVAMEKALFEPAERMTEAVKAEGPEMVDTPGEGEKHL